MLLGFPSTAKLLAVLRAATLFLLQQGIQIPSPTGLVNDFAHVLRPDAVQRMERIAEDVRAKSRGEMTIVTLPDIGTRDVQEVALQIGRQWKVGKIGNPGDPTRNAGAVILLVPKETSKDGRGHCFIATGRGAEGFITDADAGDICREATPAFKAQDYSSGLELVTLRAAQRFANEFHFSLDTTLAPPPMVQSPDNYPSSGGGGIPPFAIFIIFLIVLFILSMARRRGTGGCAGPGCLPIIIPTGGFGGGRGGCGLIDSNVTHIDRQGSQLVSCTLPLNPNPEKDQMRALTVALVDDVLITGASLAEAAKVLKASGAVSVKNWVVARTLPPAN